MSTNFLNRRMDLLHSVTANTNYLTMDTSYPVKIAGKILKLFTADNIFNTNGWVLQNTEGETILTINSNHVYDFAGRVIKNNIGEEKAYATNADVYKLNDYVMVIIDFDEEHSNANPSIHLCSQTNFENFITGGVEGGNGNIKLFNITGENVIDGSFDNLGIDEDVLDVAIEFENEESEELDDKTYSLVRNDLDNILWEKPINNNNVKSATPVANVNNININGVNVSIQNFIFPELNASNCYRGWDATEDMKMYKSIEGSVNDDFIDTYCFTNEELQNLAIYPMEYLQRFYENITGDKNDYVYAIGHIGPFSASQKNHPTDLFYAYPIKKNDNKFKILDIVNNKALTCGGSEVSIASLSTKLCDICGSYWAGEHINGYTVTHHVWKTDISNKTRISFTHKQINDTDCCSYSKYIDNNKYANTKLAPLGYSAAFSNNSGLLADITRFIDFFGNDDNNYKEAIKKMIVSLSNNGYGNGSNTSVMFRNDDSSASIIGNNTLPINVVALYPEFFENILYGGERSSNTSIRNCLISAGKDYKFNKRQATWWWGSELSRTIVYNLFDRYDVQDNLIKPTFVNTASMDVTINGEDSSYVMRPMSHFNTDNSAILIDKDGKHNIVFIVNYLMLNTINTPYYETEKPDYNNAEMSTQSVMVLFEDVKFASECIVVDGSDNLTAEIDGVNYDLYTVRRENNVLSYVRATTSNLKDTTSDSKGITYLYYFDETNAEVHRLKYFFKVSDGTGVRPYDFFKDTILFKQAQVSTSSADYRREFNNAYISAYKTINGVTEQAAVDNYNTTVMNNYAEVILYVVDNYKFFPYNLSEGTNLPAYDGHSALSIAELDYSVNHACSENVYTTVRELIDSDYAVVINCKAPHASAIKVNDSYVYNVASYNKWLKNTKVSDVFVTGMFPYINGCGIRKEYYDGLSLYDFFLYAVNRDLGRKLNSDNSFYILENSGISFFTKDEINKIKVLEDTNGTYYFKDASNNAVTVSTNLNFKNNINKRNIFGFNPVTIENNDGEDVSDNWNSSDTVYLIKNDTGSKTVYSIAMNDGNPNNPTIMSTNGNIDVIDAENIKWSDLLLALNNNKSVDILSTSLKYVKSQIKTLMNNTQNINSNVSMDDNITQADADAHDSSREGQDEFSPSSSHYKTQDAVFDSEHNVYNFNYGYGFTDRVREINNRGVIVFESKDFKTNQIRSQSVGETPDDYKYQTVEGTVYARRMYINNDGLLCTKEYFDNEAAEYTPAGGTEPVYPENPTTIAALLKKIEELENRIAALEGN
jgi:hypothetical protein